MNKTKVKIFKFGSSKTNKLTLVLGGTIATIFLLILLKSWLDKSKEVPSAPVVKKPLKSQVQTGKNEDVSEGNVSVVRAVPGLGQQAARATIAKNTDWKTIQEEYKRRQEKIKTEFQDLVKLKIELPGHLHYSTVDPEEGIAGVVGTSLNRDETFAALAAHGTVPLEKVITFLNEGSPSLPMMNGHRPMMDKIFTDPSPASTGLGELTIIPCTESHGKRLFAVLAPRLDGKGTYLFLRQGHPDSFESNEGYFDQLLGSMKAE